MFNTARYLGVTLVLVVLAGIGFVFAATSASTLARILGLVGALLAAAVAFSYYLSVRTKRSGATPIPR